MQPLPRGRGSVSSVKHKTTFPGFALVAIAVTLAALPAYAAEPIVGRWVLTSQEVNGQKTTPQELMLRVAPAGDAYEFAYSTPRNNKVQFVSLRFVVRLEGREADVTDGNGGKIGDVRITKAGPSLYRMVLEGPDRPTASGTIIVSADGRTLKSESDAGAVHTVQIFTRQ